jgi:hypothetical protein
MSSYGLTYKSTMCRPEIYASKFVAISIFIIASKKLHFPHNMFLFAKKMISHYSSS